MTIEDPARAVRIALASPEEILSWSHGEVTEPETLSYRTSRPVPHGLQCEKIFGPERDFRCYCDRYKGIRYKGVVCDKCGVEIAHRLVRRERMAHIELAAPVVHPWFMRPGTANLGHLLHFSLAEVRDVAHFARMVAEPANECARSQLLDSLQREIERLELASASASDAADERAQPQFEDPIHEETEGLRRLRRVHQGQSRTRRKQKEKLKSELKALRARLRRGDAVVLTEAQRSTFDPDDLLLRVSMGAAALLETLNKLDASGSTADPTRGRGLRRQRALRRIHAAGINPTWMFLTVLPVLPADLRPMVPLKNGDFATSDLTELYRSVIVRNNRLKALLERGAPEIVLRNERRILQDAVDSLFENGSGGRRNLKSLTDALKGKQGRFRQNLLGKRVDYSGRSVIVVGPELNLHQCGLPRRMALDLFKPFLIHELVARGIASGKERAKRMVERRSASAIWQILEGVVATRPVLLNRAPTLHRLGIQAFEPVLIDGAAIQLHPLVCTAFNADFDGDQMAVHVPLSRAAVAEARQIMLSTRNLLSSSSGEPIIAPTLDIVLGCYYLTDDHGRADGEKKPNVFANAEEARYAYDVGVIALHEAIRVRLPYEKRQGADAPGDVDPCRSDLVSTTVGRIIFNEVLPRGVASAITGGIDFINQTMDRKTLNAVVARCCAMLASDETAVVVDSIKELGFDYATRSGMSIAVNDLRVPAEKVALIKEADDNTRDIDGDYDTGLLTEQERYAATVAVWTRTTDEVKQTIQDQLGAYGSLHTMVASGARGNISQITQMAGMRGLMTAPSGRVIDLPIRSSFREGLSVLEYFISTHGARKGLIDTALRTAPAGYLTRRLVDVAHDVIVLEEDCGTRTGICLNQADSDGLPSVDERIIGRYAAKDLIDPESGEVIVGCNEEIDARRARRLGQLKITRAYVRSALTCQAKRGICRYCYGRSPATGVLVAIGQAVGVLAAQSIGEPGIQLTLRTFHTGGVADGADITAGLPRVEELFEARKPKHEGLLSEIDGVAEILQDGDSTRIRIGNLELFSDEYKIPSGATVLVKMGQMIGRGAVIAVATIHGTRTEIVACVSGRVTIREDSISVVSEEREEREYEVPAPARLKIENGDRIHAGQQLTEGSLNPQDIHRIMGMESAQLYLVEEVKKVYRSQGVTINDKHIEVIARQMALRQVTVRDPGDTDLPASGIVDRFEYEASNAGVLAQGGDPAIAVPVLVGITKASLHAGSFLSAASFQETRRVLTEAAIGGQSDKLLGLKENVIVGRLIPARARVDIPPAPRRATIASVDWEASFPSQHLPDEVEEVDDIEDPQDTEDFEDFALYDPDDQSDDEAAESQNRS